MDDNSLRAPIDLETPPVIGGFEHIKRYWDSAHNILTAKILPGEYYVSRNNEGITTVLGSCISACIRDPRSGVGGMNHFMLPGTEAADYSASQSSWSQSARYGNHAMELMINAILKNGGKRENLEVKIFGGGKIIKNMTDVGERNIEFALNYIQNEGLLLISQDVGEEFPRKVYYNPKNGQAKVKKLRSLHDNTIASLEIDYMSKITNKPVTGSIDLF